MFFLFLFLIFFISSSPDDFLFQGANIAQSSMFVIVAAFAAIDAVRRRWMGTVPPSVPLGGTLRAQQFSGWTVAHRVGFKFITPHALGDMKIFPECDAVLGEKEPPRPEPIILDSFSVYAMLKSNFEGFSVLTSPYADGFVGGRSSGLTDSGDDDVIRVVKGGHVVWANHEGTIRESF